MSSLQIQTSDVYREWNGFITYGGGNEYVDANERYYKETFNLLNVLEIFSADESSSDHRKYVTSSSQLPLRQFTLLEMKNMRWDEIPYYREHGGGISSCSHGNPTIPWNLIITSNYRQIWRLDCPVSLILSSIVGGVYEQNSTVNKCLCRWLDSWKGDHC